MLDHLSNWSVNITKLTQVSTHQTPIFAFGFTNHRIPFGNRPFFDTKRSVTTMSQQVPIDCGLRHPPIATCLILTPLGDTYEYRPGRLKLRSQMLTTTYTDLYAMDSMDSVLGTEPDLHKGITDHKIIDIFPGIFPVSSWTHRSSSQVKGPHKNTEPENISAPP